MNGYISQLFCDYLNCRPGAYEHSVKRNRKVNFHGSFGGPQTLIASVQVKCNEFGEPDIVSVYYSVVLFLVILLE